LRKWNATRFMQKRCMCQWRNLTTKCCFFVGKTLSKGNSVFIPTKLKPVWRSSFYNYGLGSRDLPPAS
jgi:hypothetical protein